jgi:hypothetical protein
MQFSFGTGQLFALPVGGGAPLKVGALQDVSVEFSGDNKELYGQNQFPLDNARGKTKITGKAGMGVMDADLFNSLFFGSTTVTGQKKQAFNEAGTVPAMTTFTVTVANSADFYLDLGVVYAATGAPLKQVASAPTIGQYTVVAGVYTFAAADASANVLITYLYTDTTSGSTLQLTNNLMGNTPKFQAVLAEIYEGKFVTLVLYSCVSSKLTLPLKQDNYTIPEIDFSAQDNGSGSIGFLSISG